MKHFVLLVSFFALLLQSQACCNVVTPADDPQPWGGAPCTTDIDCFNNTCNSTGFCECNEDRGNPDCSYERFDKNLCGGLQFICFVGVGGIGNLVCRRIGMGVGQIILTQCWIFMCCVICCGGCIGAIAGIKKSKLSGAGIITFSSCFGIITCAAGLAGFIWSIIDGAYMLRGYYQDGNGYAMY